MATAAPAPDTVRVDFACNDPDNGNFAGLVSSISIYGEGVVLELEAPGRERRIAIDEDSFRLAGKRFAHVGRVWWIGNWCWDGLWMELEEARRMLAWLHLRRLFVCTCADSILFEQWRERGRFGGPHLMFELSAASHHQRGRR